MKQKSILLEIFGETPELKVIDFLIGNNIFDYTKTEIANGAGISRPTLYKFWEKLVKSGLLIKTRKINRTQLFKVNTDSIIIKKIMEIEMKIGLKEVERPHGIKPIAIKA